MEAMIGLIIGAVVTLCVMVVVLVCVRSWIDQIRSN